MCKPTIAIIGHKPKMMTILEYILNNADTKERIFNPETDSYLLPLADEVGYAPDSVEWEEVTQ